jgi:hypothetical protein
MPKENSRGTRHSFSTSRATAQAVRPIPYRGALNEIKKKKSIKNSEQLGRGNKTAELIKLNWLNS